MDKKVTILAAATLAIILMGAITSQVNTYVNGNILTATQLNSEFGNIYSTINNLDDANLTAAANINPAKISATIDGSGISRNGTTGALSVSPDGVTLENNADSVRIKDAGVTLAKMAANSVGTSNIVDANVTLAKMAASSVNSSNIVDGAIVNADVNASAAIASSKLDLAHPLTVGDSGSGLQLSVSGVYGAVSLAGEVGMYYASSSVSISCDTSCALVDDSAGFHASSGHCLGANRGDGNYLPVTCSDAAAGYPKSCLCMGRRI